MGLRAGRFLSEKVKYVVNTANSSAENKSICLQQAVFLTELMKR